MERYQQSREDLKKIHAKNYDNLRETYEEQALDYIIKEYKKCSWRGGLFAKDVLKYNRHVFDCGSVCITVHFSDKGIFFLGGNGLMKPLVGQNCVKLNLNNLAALLEVVTTLNKTKK